MNTSPWSCQETDQHFPAYRQDALAPEQAEALFQHILACDRCHALHFQPAREESELMMNLLLNAMEAPEPTPSSEHPTLTGENTGLSLSEWTSSGQLDFGLGELPPPMALPFDTQPETQTPHGPHLRQVGILLPHVSRKQHIQAYWLYLGDGLPRPDQTRTTPARLSVTETDIRLELLGDHVVLDGRRLPVGTEQVLSWTHVLEVQEQICLLERSHTKETQRLGMGFLRFRGAWWPLNESLTVGRGEQAQLRLPNRDLATNLRLDASAPRADSSVFLDGISVSREHARVTRSAHGTYTVEALGRFPVWRHAKGLWQSLEHTGTPLEVTPGDELLIGQTLLQLSEG